MPNMSEKNKKKCAKMRKPIRKNKLNFNNSKTLF